MPLTNAGEEAPGAGERFAFEALLASDPTYDAAGALLHRGGYTDARGVRHAMRMTALGNVDQETYVADGVTRVEEDVYPTDLLGSSEPSASRRMNTLRRASHRTVNGVLLSSPMTFDTLGRPSRQRKVDGSLVHSWDFAADGWLLEEGLAATLFVQRYERDAAGHVTRSSDGAATTFAVFDANNRVTETRDALANTTTYGYANAGCGCGCSQDNLVTSIHTPDLPAGVDWTMTYDAEGRLASLTDPQLFTETYQYAPTGERTKVKDKLGRDSTWTHDQLGRILTMVDTLGRTHASTYDLPAAGVWVGPALMAGSADAAVPVTSLSGALRSGDYQIGRNAQLAEGFGAQISLYRDATFQLGFTHFYDAANRRTRRKDRTGIAIDAVTIPPFGADGAVWDQVLSYNVFTSLPIVTARSSARGAGSVEGASWSHTFDFDVASTNGFYAGTSPAYLLESYLRDAGGRPTQLTRRFEASAIFGLSSVSTYA